MRTVYLEQLNQNIRLYSFSAIIIGLIILWALLILLKRLVNKQVDTQVSEFAKKARIPKVLKDRIGLKIKWR